MIYCQLRNRAKIGRGQRLHLRDVATLIAPEAAQAIELRCPNEPGVWKLDAIAVARALQGAYPHESLTMLGADTCYVHRIDAPGRDPWRWMRTTAALAILMLGSALGLAWFHSDVDMPAAQLAVYETLTGEAPEDSRVITVPYCIGVALGVAVFYALPSRRATTPLDVKLSTYQEDMEQTEGKEIE